MAFIYALIGFLIALFLPNRVDDAAKWIVLAAWSKVCGWLKK